MQLHLAKGNLTLESAGYRKRIEPEEKVTDI